MYILIKNNIVEQYPYNEGQLKIDNPQVSFPTTISKETLAEYDVYEVVATDAPSITYKQNIVEGTPVNEEGTWKQTWVVTDKSAEEISIIQEYNRKQAYIDESDPLFFKWQRGEIDKQVWLDKVTEIKQRFPDQ
jgi:hypothetical protein